MGDPGYTLPAEIVNTLFHKRGALAAARTGDHMNPQRRSSGSQFYIVHGNTFDDATLDIFARQIQMALHDNTFNFSEEMRAVYRSQGGAPNLDGQYTVFGEVVEGFDVLDAVAAIPTPGKTRQRTNPQLTDRPIEDVRMTIRPLPEYAAEMRN
jgi:peptidyl-prolyl cis-trans isomerase B (cyclophilin B)